MEPVRLEAPEALTLALSLLDAVAAIEDSWGPNGHPLVPEREHGVRVLSDRAWPSS